MLHHEREECRCINITPLSVGVLASQLDVLDILRNLSAVDNFGNELAVVIEIVFKLNDSGLLIPAFACLKESVTYVLLCNHCYTFC